MLQQTRVETVIAYYERFLERFPTLRTLAEAPLPEVLKAWEGLGYYRRARHLHQAAQRALAMRGGVPPTHAALRELPGVGAYTAAAIAAIAFGERQLPVDGNIRRVLARLFDRAPRTDAGYRTLGEPLVHGIPRRDVSGMVQALMELGALICAPRRPRCLDCPVARSCGARLAGTIALRPPRRRRPAIPHHDVVVACLRNARRRVCSVGCGSCRAVRWSRARDSKRPCVASCARSSVPAGSGASRTSETCGTPTRTFV
jgi:A/G-specific adenine glycosylase